MTLEPHKKMSQGIRCKACNNALDDVSFDPELCSACLAVVAQVNHDLADHDEEEELFNEEEEI